jgi:nucleotide-binding universal stress UspA family protein
MESAMTLIPPDSLAWLVGLLREGRAYYRHAAEHTNDPEVRRAFELAAEERDMVLADLRAVGAIEESHTPADVANALKGAPPQHRYHLLQEQFDPARPELQAEALVAREGAGLRLVESVFRSHHSLAVRRIMKVHYPRLQQSARIMQRLARRDHAA